MTDIHIINAIICAGFTIEPVWNEQRTLCYGARILTKSGRVALVYGSTAENDAAEPEDAIHALIGAALRQYHNHAEGFAA